MARILVTGASGFIGSALCPALAARGHRVVPVLRRQPGLLAPHSSRPGGPLVADIAPQTDWVGLLDGIELVVHLAQRAHRRADARLLAGEPQAAATLACAAAHAGVRRLLYMSSIKAMGEATPPGQRFRAGDPAQPEDAYGRTKLATEAALTQVADATGLEVVILRPPLVYGPGVKGNFRALARLAASGLPLPFAAVANRRSLIFLDNLVDLVATAAVHPAAAGRVLLAADGDDLSTATLIRRLAEGQGRVARLFALPEPIFAALRRLPAIGAAVARLTLSLQVDDRETRERLDWTPPIAAEPALIATARALAAR